MPGGSAERPPCRGPGNYDLIFCIYAKGARCYGLVLASVGSGSGAGVGGGRARRSVGVVVRSYRRRCWRRAGVSGGVGAGFVGAGIVGVGVVSEDCR